MQIDVRPGVTITLIDGEPCIVIRASDRLAASAVYSYACSVIAAAHGCQQSGDLFSANKLHKLCEHLEALSSNIIDWQIAHSHAVRLPQLEEESNGKR